MPCSTCGGQQQTVVNLPVATFDWCPQCGELLDLVEHRVYVPKWSQVMAVEIEMLAGAGVGGKVQGIESEAERT